MKEFATALKAKQDQTLGDEALEFDVVKYDEDGKEVERVRLRALPPNAAQMAVAMAGVGRHVDMQTKIATVIDFFYEVLDPDSAAYVRSRLLNREDSFGLTEVTDIMHWLIEEWTGNPTQEPSGSPSSQGSTGPSSSPSTSDTTSSTSQPVAS